MVLAWGHSAPRYCWLPTPASQQAWWRPCRRPRAALARSGGSEPDIAVRASVAPRVTPSQLAMPPSTSVKWVRGLDQARYGDDEHVADGQAGDDEPGARHDGRNAEGQQCDQGHRRATAA
jgi:hypothetical protein